MVDDGSNTEFFQPSSNVFLMYKTLLINGIDITTNQGENVFRNQIQKFI